MNVRDGIPLPSRSLVRPPVDERMSPRAPDPSHRSAGAEEPEADPSQRVTTHAAVVDTQRNTAYRHGMESHGFAKDTFGRGGASFRDSGEGVPPGAPVTAPGKAAHHPLAAGRTSPLELGSLRRVWVAVRGSRTAAWVGDTEAQVKQRAHHSSSYSYEEWWERLEETESGLRFWNVSDALQHELAESSARWLL